MNQTTTDKPAHPNPDRHLAIEIDGMHCASCVNRIESALSAVPGVTRANVNMALERADVTGAETLDRSALHRAVRDAGYQVRETRPAHDHDHSSGHGGRIPVKLIASGMMTLPLVLQMIFMASGKMTAGDGTGFHLPPLVECLLASAVLFWCGSGFFRAAWSSLKATVANMDLLVVLGTFAAWGYSVYLWATLGELAAGRLYFEATAVIVTLVLLGRWLEDRARKSSRAAIDELMKLRPRTARVLVDGVEQDISVDDLKQEDMIVIRPGERIAADGIVTKGASQSDEALVTGESLPVAKKIGDHVIGGAINGTGALVVRVTALGEDSVLGRITQLVEAAQAEKAPIQRLVDKVASIFVPVVILIAIVTFAGWLAIGSGFETALTAAISVLVIACPCALGLATPTAVVTGTGIAARHGILIRDIGALEKAHALDIVIFDKTGTLTRGEVRIEELQAVDSNTDDMLMLVASAQRSSEHPIAQAFIARAQDAGISLKEPEDFQSMTGQGIQANVNGHIVLVGTQALLLENGISEGSMAKLANGDADPDRNVIWIGIDGKAAGFAIIGDEIREEARAAIQAVKALHVAPIIMSGDNAQTVKKVGDVLGVELARGRCTPADKAEYARKLASEGRHVGMVGDGVNDAPALAAAEVGFAMGSGTDVAMQTASITLMRSDPRLVASAISVSRATWRKIRQNLFWAFIYNAIGIPAAALGYLSPEIAGAAMALSSVSVVGNSLLLKRWKPETIKG